MEGMTSSSSEEGSFKLLFDSATTNCGWRALATTQHNTTQHDIYHTNIVVLCWIRFSCWIKSSESSSCLPLLHVRPEPKIILEPSCLISSSRSAAQKDPHYSFKWFQLKLLIELELDTLVKFRQIKCSICEYIGHLINKSLDCLS